MSTKADTHDCTGPFSDAFDCPVHNPRTKAEDDLLRRLDDAEKWLRLELEGPCCPGPAIHFKGADALHEARERIAQMAQQVAWYAERYPALSELYDEQIAENIQMENVLSSPVAAELLVILRAECESQHARAEQAEAQLREAEAARAPLLALVERWTRENQYGDRQRAAELEAALRR